MRNIIIRTGAGGMDLFETAIEESAGLKRVRIGNKVPRILRTKTAVIKRSHVGYYYKLIGFEKIKDVEFKPIRGTYKYKKEDISLEMIKETISGFFNK